jgi:FkbM family methyltransferase
MKKIEKKIKDYLIKLYPFNKLYFFLKILKKSKKRYHYADNGEDIIIQGLFNHKKNGFYIDVGCYHPVRASLTHLLYKKGWKGVNIDISKDTINLFNIARPNDKNINIGIADKAGEDFYYQSSHINQANSFKFYDNVKKVKVQITTLDNIIKNLGIEKIDFLNIDVEYRDFKALQGLNLNNVRPSLIAIEDNDAYDIADVTNSNIYRYMINNEYFLYSKLNCTNFYLDKKYKNNLNDILNTQNKNSL